MLVFGVSDHQADGPSRTPSLARARTEKEVVHRRGRVFAGEPLFVFVGRPPRTGSVGQGEPDRELDAEELGEPFAERVVRRELEEKVPDSSPGSGMSGCRSRPRARLLVAEHALGPAISCTCQRIVSVFSNRIVRIGPRVIRRVLFRSMMR